MLRDPHVHVQVAGRGAALAGLALAPIVLTVPSLMPGGTTTVSSRARRAPSVTASVIVLLTPNAASSK